MGKFEERMKEIRLASGLSQAEMAQLLGYAGGRSTICMIEKGKRSVSIDRMKEFAKILGVAPEWLIGWDDDADALPEMDKVEARFKKYFEALNEVGQKKALEYLKDLNENGKYRK